MEKNRVTEALAGTTNCNGSSACAAYSACTHAARWCNTARWLIEPLSVTSPLSMCGRHVEQAPAADQGGAAGGLRGQVIGEGFEKRLNGRVAKYLQGWCLGTQLGQTAAGVHAREQQGAHLVLVQPRDNSVLNARVTLQDDARAQGPDADKGARGQFEVFSHPAVKAQAPLRLLRVDPTHGVASLVKTFGVKSLGG